MIITHLNNDLDKRRYLEQLKPALYERTCLEDKMSQKLFSIKGLDATSAHLLKQNALSLGADVAIEEALLHEEHQCFDALLICNTFSLKKLIKKNLSQNKSLRFIAHELNRYLEKKEQKEILVMGVLNANEDSFFQESRFNASSAQERLEKMIEEGANIIDIGAVSSRPGSVGVSEKEELARVHEIIDVIYQQKLYEKAHFSLDSYAPLVIDYALSHGFKIVNDITGFSNDEVCRLCGIYQAQGVVMHMQGTPSSMQENPQYENVLHEVELFFQERIQKMQSFGITDIVLDVGIGFGKTLEHNLTLIQHLKHFQKFSFPLLVGASRKSLIDKIIPTPTQERLAGTLAVHLAAVEGGAEILRVHDVKEHVQALKVFQAIKGS